MILKIDVDGNRKLSRAELERRARIVHVEIVAVTDTRSPSGRGWHRRIEIERVGGIDLLGGKLVRPARLADSTVAHDTSDRKLAPPTPFSPLEIVALQLLFGSDPIRECFNFHRARLVEAGQVSRFWARRWNNLYPTKNGKLAGGYAMSGGR